MLAGKRYRKIIEYLQYDGSIKTSELSEKLNVSSETIRRDLENMESQGLLHRIHGGAILTNYEKIGTPTNLAYSPFGQRERLNVKNKIEIAELASEYIEEGQSVALDSGTTSFELARVIKRKFNNLTVVTNSLAIANELSDAKGISLVLTGGLYKPDEAAFTTDLAAPIFDMLSINTFFLTTCGISVERGVTYQRIDEVIVQDKMMESSEKTIVIADSSKLGVNSLVKMCDVDKIDMIITDSESKEEQIIPFINKNIKVIKP